MSSSADIKPSDKYIPWLFVLFFITFMIVDAIMVTLAVRTQTGLVTEQAYEKGLSYNDTLDAAAEQESWGWQDTISVNDGNILYVLKNEHDMPVTEAIVTADFIRPVKDGYDFKVPLTQNSQGHYQTNVSFPLKGEWGVRVKAKWNNKQYQSYETFIIH